MAAARRQRGAEEETAEDEGVVQTLEFKPYFIHLVGAQAGGCAGGGRAAPARRRGGDGRGHLGAAQPAGAGAARLAGAAARARGRRARARGRQRRVLHLHGRALHAQAALRAPGED